MDESPCGFKSRPAHKGLGVRPVIQPDARRMTGRIPPSPYHMPKKQFENLKIIPLGGLEEIGRNMMLFEYRKEIMIIDMGFQFPEEDMPGIDFIIPNISYLKGKEKQIRGVVITHGHYDHIGAIPYLIDKLGNPLIYTTPLTRGIILKRQDDFPHLPKLNIKTFKKGERFTLGPFKIETFHVNHNIPDGVGLAIQTPAGLIVHSGDFKFDHTPIGDKPADIAKIKRIGAKGVLLLFSDSTNAEEPGHSISEKEVQENLEKIFKEAEGRIIIATFASLISRIQEVINLAEKYGRKVAVDGYSMRMNVEIAQKLNYLKAHRGTLIKIDKANDYPPSKIVILGTGAQGEGNAVLMRIIQKEHRFIKIQKGDSVVFSSSVIPGHELAIQDLKDNLYRQGANVYHYRMLDIHTSGHGRKEDLKEMIGLIKPKFFIPIHGNYYMLKLHTDIARASGIPAKNILIAGNGNIINASPQKMFLEKKKVPTNYVMVDGLGIGDVGEIVLRDRQTLARDGMCVIIVLINSKTGKIKGEPDIISRGFIYMKESKELLNQTRKKVKEIIKKTSSPEHTLNWAIVKDDIRNKIGDFLFSKTRRRPMILPVVIEI